MTALLSFFVGKMLRAGLDTGCLDYDPPTSNLTVAGYTLGARCKALPFCVSFNAAAAVALYLIALLGAMPAFAQSGHHGQGHAENHDWYQNLKQPGTGYSCCNGSVNGVEGDCRPTRAYLGDDGVWRALINGRWERVPPNVVLPAEQNREPFTAHICVSKSGYIYCFLEEQVGG